MLQKSEPDDEVLIFDPNSGDWESITGMVYGGGRHIVKLYSDLD